LPTRASTPIARFDLIYRREAGGPNAIWQADHTQLDVWIRDERDRPRKPWLTVILDGYSRAVASYRLACATPTTLPTTLTLRDAILPKPDPYWPVCGIPSTFYTDHGADFTSRHLEQVAADLAMTLVFSLVGQPRGRGRIERFFQTVSQLCLGTLPGYAPPGTPPPTTMLTLVQLDARLNRFVVAGYHQRVHSETGMAPQARRGRVVSCPGCRNRPRSSTCSCSLWPRRGGCTRRHPLPGPALPRSRPGGLRRGDGDDPLRPARPGRDPDLPPGPLPLPRPLSRAGGATIGLKELVRARAKLVELLLGVHADVPMELTPPAEPAPPAPRLKRYYHE
jgi:transposase InsO family protein